jgi:hypothetical protein
LNSVSDLAIKGTKAGCTQLGRINKTESPWGSWRGEDGDRADEKATVDTERGKGDEAFLGRDRGDFDIAYFKFVFFHFITFD